MHTFLTRYLQKIWSRRYSRQNSWCALLIYFSSDFFQANWVCQLQRCSQFRDALNNRLTRIFVFPHSPKLSLILACSIKRAHGSCHDQSLQVFAFAVKVLCIFVCVYHLLWRSVLFGLVWELLLKSSSLDIFLRSYWASPAFSSPFPDTIVWSLLLSLKLKVSFLFQVTIKILFESIRYW